MLNNNNKHTNTSTVKNEKNGIKNSSDFVVVDEKNDVKKTVLGVLNNKNKKNNLKQTSGTHWFLFFLTF